MLSCPRAITTAEIMTNTEANMRKIVFIPKLLEIMTPTSMGASMPPIRPKPAAQPLPRARMEVGYCSGV